MLLAALSAHFPPLESRHAATSNFSKEITKFGFSAIEEVQSFIVEPKLVVILLSCEEALSNYTR